MKEFDLEQARKQNGEGLITRDGRSARIVCWDRESNEGYPILALIKEGLMEAPQTYTTEGIWRRDMGTRNDLFLATTKHEGWVNIVTSLVRGYCEIKGNKIWGTEREAKENIPTMAMDENFTIATIKIECGTNYDRE